MPRRSKPPYSYSEAPSRKSKYGNSSPKKSSFIEGLNYTIAAICAGIFMLGIGLGIALSSGQASNSPPQCCLSGGD